MAVNEEITITALCPRCGGEATWHGHRPDTCQETVYDWINCPTCDQETP